MSECGLSAMIRKFTFGEMLKQIRSIAYRLETEGVAFGDRVALIGENHPCWAIAYLGTIYRGAVIVPWSARRNRNYHKFLENSEAKVAFLSPDITEKFQQIEGKTRSSYSCSCLEFGKFNQRFQKFEDWRETDFPEAFAQKIPVTKMMIRRWWFTHQARQARPKAFRLHGNIVAELDGINKVINLSSKWFDFVFASRFFTLICKSQIFGLQ